jgi:competence protein ComEA
MPIELSSEEISEGNTKSFSDFIYKNRIYLALILLGAIFLGSGVFLFRNPKQDPNIEIVEMASETKENKDIYVEIAGAVENPGVYSLPPNARVEDLFIKAGGLTGDADKAWMEKYVNRAAKLFDGQKIYLPRENEHSLDLSANNSVGEEEALLGTSTNTDELVNINTASQKQLESLPGIGPVYAQNVIEHRPYSSIEELVSKEALKTHVYEKIKDLITIY